MKKRNLKIRSKSLRTLLSTELVQVGGGLTPGDCPTCSGGSEA